jgi:predicted nucleic acid-binding protein
LTFCLDSWAVLRWLEGVDPAATRVDKLLPARPVMSWINAGEVYYVVHRVAGERQARAVVREMDRRLFLELPTSKRILEAAAIKATHRLAYADAFAMATAIAHDATLLTGDPELLKSGTGWKVEDLR